MAVDPCVFAMEKNGQCSVNGLTNGLKNGINGHINGYHKNGYHNGYNQGLHQGPNGLPAQVNGYVNGMNGYNNHKNGYTHNGNGYNHGQNGFSKGTNGLTHDHMKEFTYNNNTYNNNNYLPGEIVAPVLLKTVLKSTRYLTSRRLRIIVGILMMFSQAAMTIILSYKPAFKTVAPMTVTITSDLLSTLIATLCLLWYDCSMDRSRLKNHLYTYLCQRPKDTLMSAVVIVFYPVIDQLQQLALRDVGTKSFKVVNHAGVIATMVACSHIFGRRPRPLQVWSIIIFVGCTQLMEYSNCPPNEEFIAPHKLTKFIWITVSWAAIVVKMVLTSSYVVYLEYFIRCDRNVSVWTRLVQIGVWKTITDIGRMVFIDGAYVQENGFFTGFNSLVFSYVLLRSLSILLGFVSILYFDSLGKTLQQNGGILLGMQVSSILLSNYFCFFSFLSCIAAIIATVAYLQWSGRGKDFKKEQSAVLSPNNSWEIWYLDSMNGDLITMWVLSAIAYLCVWCLILFSVGEKIQSLLLKSMTPFLVLVLINILLCFRLKDNSTRFTFRSSVFICVLSVVCYVVLIIIKLDIHFYLIIM